MDNSYQQAWQKLTLIGQQHLLSYWKDLNDQQQQELVKQIESLNLDTFRQQQLLIQQPKSPLLEEIQPLTTYSNSGKPSDFIAGKEIIAQAQAGCLMVAGGQGTRLHIEGPKGTFPVTPIKHKSLFQLFAEKLAAAGRQAKRLLPLAIMTSPHNHKATIEFFEKHHFFGLDPHQVTFFTQEMLPLLNQDGNLFLENKESIAKGPDGNGMALHHFFHSGIWAHWHQQGIRSLNFIVVDNPLADPYDAELLGNHQHNHNEVTVKCVLRQNRHEKVGVLAKIKEKTVVVEYSELPASMAEAVCADGSLEFACANISLFCFSMDFIKSAIESSPHMPLHKAFKAASYLDDFGIQHPAHKPMAWKFETFIFDLLPLAQKVGAILYPREQCFAPLKNFEGEDSISTVRQALQKNDRRIFSEISLAPCKAEPFEIAQDFYYPTPGLIAKWRHASAPSSSYVES